MVKFYDLYSAPSFLQVSEQLGIPQIFQTLIGKSEEIFQSAIGKMPNILLFTTYTNHIDIMNRCRSTEERIFYMLYSHRENLQNRELKRCIKTDTFGSLLGGSQKSMSKMLKDCKHSTKYTPYGISPEAYPDVAVAIIKGRR